MIQETRSMMGMTISVTIADQKATQKNMNTVFAYFDSIDQRFSPYKITSEVSAINQGKLKAKHYSQDLKVVLALSEKTKQETGGYFNIVQNKYLDPSGLVKGWAINNAALILKKQGLVNFYIDAGGDIQTSGVNSEKKKWTVGIRNPFNKAEIVKVLEVSGQAVATSGTYERGLHIYNPLSGRASDQIASLTVVGPNIYEADRFATAAFAMGELGISFIEKQKDLEGYSIDKNGIATLTSGFEKFVKN